VKLLVEQEGAESVLDEHGPGELGALAAELRQR
jgi:hypothetical protein